MSVLHEYPIGVVWAGGRDGHGVVTAATSGTQFDIAVPPEFQGPGGASNPEELLTSAVAACYGITFGIVASNRRLPIQNVEVHAIGGVSKESAGYVFKQITISPTITLSSEATDEQVSAATDIAHKADGYCLITNAVRGKVDVVVDPIVRRA